MSSVAQLPAKFVREARTNHGRLKYVWQYPTEVLKMS